MKSFAAPMQWQVAENYYILHGVLYFIFHNKEKTKHIKTELQSGG
jgi:hypothetical protein